MSTLDEQTLRNTNGGFLIPVVVYLCYKTYQRQQQEASNDWGGGSSSGGGAGGSW